MSRYPAKVGVGILVSADGKLPTHYADYLPSIPRDWVVLFKVRDAVPAPKELRGTGFTHMWYDGPSWAYVGFELDPCWLLNPDDLKREQSVVSSLLSTGWHGDAAKALQLAVDQSTYSQVGVGLLNCLSNAYLERDGINPELNREIGEVGEWRRSPDGKSLLVASAYRGKDEEKEKDAPVPKGGGKRKGKKEPKKKGKQGMAKTETVDEVEKILSQSRAASRTGGNPIGQETPLGQALFPAIEPFVERRLQALVGEIASKQIRPLNIKFPDRPEIKLDGEHLHPCVHEGLAAVQRGEDLFLVGPPGSGKTHMAEQLARMLGYQTAMVSFSEQTMASDLFGRFIINEKGGMDWHDGPISHAFRHGETVIILDEVDRANPNTVDSLNSSLANRRCNIPARRESLVQQKVVFVACANAYASSAENTSSNTLAASFYDRFWRMEVGYDQGLEERFLNFNMPLLNKLWAVRAQVNEHKLRRHVSTRFIIRAAKASKAGLTDAQVLCQLVVGWRKEEREKLKALLPKEALA